jgi:hypothetical protein
MPVTPRDGNGASPPVTFASRISTASVYDTDYADALSYRNIYIEGDEEPPEKLMQRAMEIIMGSRSSPEIDETDARKLRKKSRRLRMKGEEAIVQQLGPSVDPGMNGDHDERLESTSGEQWTNFILSRSIQHISNVHGLYQDPNPTGAMDIRTKPSHSISVPQSTFTLTSLSKAMRQRASHSSFPLWSLSLFRRRMAELTA